MKNQSDANLRPDPDPELVQIADYALSDDAAFSQAAMETARLCLMDSIGCAAYAHRFPECAKHLGPLVAGGEIAGGARVIGARFQLDPIKAAFDNGALIRWLDYNDTWLAAEWGHPSDNLGALISVADWQSRRGKKKRVLGDLLSAMIKAHEIQGVLALENAFNRLGLDHVLLVKIASTAVVCHLLGASREETINALSSAFVDGHSLRTYRHAPNAGSRKSWAAGDACARAVRLAMMAQNGEPGMPSALSAPKWGFNDAVLRGGKLKIPRPFGCYVMENILFKISYPAEFHAQTAVECALKLHPEVKGREIARVEIHTQESAVRIISKTGALYNPADRDHCLQYMVAAPLLFGALRAEHYEDDFAADPRIDALREKMTVTEDPRYTADYLDPAKRSIANAVRVFFADGGSTAKVEVEYPVGHRRRRAEGAPLLEEKFFANLKSRLPARRAGAVFDLCRDPARLMQTPVSDFTDMLAI